MKVTTAHLRRVVIVVLAVAAMALAIMLHKVTDEGNTKVLSADQKRSLTTAPYARQVTVKLPATQVSVAVAEPTDSLGADLVEPTDRESEQRYWDLDAWHAPEGGALVPVTWSVQALGGFLRDADTSPTIIRLVAGDKTIPLASANVGEDSSATRDLLDPHSEVFAIGDDIDLDDITVEIEYDGVTQVVHPSSGEIDTGAAEPLYVPEGSYSSGCIDIDDECDLHGRSADGSVRADNFTFTSSHVTLYSYDHALGWAEEGRLWAGVRLSIFDRHAVTASGDWIDVTPSARPQVTLDGAEPIRREGLTTKGYVISGRAVFDVAADTTPRTLELEQVYDLAQGRGKLPVRASIRLEAQQ